MAVVRAQSGRPHVLPERSNHLKVCTLSAVKLESRISRSSQLFSRYVATTAVASRSRGARRLFCRTRLPARLL